MPRFAAIAAKGLALAGVLISVAAVANGMRSTKEGAFTPEQATRGKQVYEQSCKNCHQAEFYTEKLLRWENKSVDALFQTVSTTMPADNVGSLATSEYVDVLAYDFDLDATAGTAGSLNLAGSVVITLIATRTIDSVAFDYTGTGAIKSVKQGTAALRS